MPTLPAVVERSFAWLERKRHLWRTWGLLVALALFVGGLAWALSSVRDIGERLRLDPFLLLVLIGAPVSTGLNAVELHAMSRIAGGPMRWRTAVDVTVYTSAANFLPLPGGFLTRLAAMKMHGVGFRTGSLTMIMSFMIWGGLAFLYSSAALLWIGKAVLAGLFAATGLCLLLLCLAAFRRYLQWKLISVIVLMRLLSFPLDALRFMFAVAAIGSVVGFAAASVFAVASFVAAAVVLAPAGLGFREAAVAILSPAVSIDPAIGFLASTAGRVAWMIGLALTALAVLLLLRERDRKAISTEDRDVK